MSGEADPPPIAVSIRPRPRSDEDSRGCFTVGCSAWERRALQALLSALEDQPTGRPKSPTDPEKETLQRRVQQLEQQVQLHQEYGRFDTVGGKNRLNLRKPRSIVSSVYGRLA